MLRSILVLVLPFALFAPAWANLSVVPLQESAGKKVDGPSAAESRQKIVAELRSEYEKLQDQLSKADAGADTRKLQKRIIELLTELLKQEDPDPRNSPSGAANPPPPMNPEPPKSPPPAPMAQKPAPKQTPTAGEPQPLKKPTGNTTTSSPTDRPANSLEKLLKEQKASERWGELPDRHRVQMEAHRREEFMHRYEELLRAYYRNIAEGARRKIGE